MIHTKQVQRERESGSEEEKESGRERERWETYKNCWSERREFCSVPSLALSMTWGHILFLSNKVLSCAYFTCTNMHTYFFSLSNFSLFLPSLSSHTFPSTSKWFIITVRHWIHRTTHIFKCIHIFTTFLLPTYEPFLPLLSLSSNKLFRFGFKNSWFKLLKTWIERKRRDRNRERKKEKKWRGKKNKNCISDPFR